MRVIHAIAEFREWRRERAAGGLPGAVAAFVPTMGALHAGHVSLVTAARRLAGRDGVVMASIFVNPTQFGPAEDFAKYPRTLESDVKMLEGAGCDAVLALPSADEMYTGIQNSVMVEPGSLGEVLEGAIRPGHFRGVCTVVAKLLNIVQPTHLLLGQKDFQQQAILRRMCGDLNFGVEVVTCPTLRESDGLAMSSRNRYLSAEDRERAVGLFEGLSWGRQAIAGGERRVEAVEAGMRERIERRRAGGAICRGAAGGNACRMGGKSTGNACSWRRRRPGRVGGGRYAVDRQHGRGGGGAGG